MSAEEPSPLVAMVIWTLRVFLPILLFILYYRVSLPSGARMWPFAGKHRRTRQDLLQYRKVLSSSPLPDCFSNFKTVDIKQAPHLFVKKTRADARGRPAGAGGASVAKDVSRGDGKAKSDGPLPEEMLHLESLLNYMAFNRKQHRIFHPTEVPPPPSSPHPPMTGEPPSADFQSKANLDAQMVLKGAIHYKKFEVVHDVFESLTGARVTPAEKTFELMVESMISAGDLPKASEFLMKMEQSGYAPDASLLDKVMELYARHKLENDLGEKLGKDSDEAANIGLSADATEFIPEFTPGGGFEPAPEDGGAAAPWLSAWGEGGENWEAAEPSWSTWTGPAEDGPWASSQWGVGDYGQWQEWDDKEWNKDWSKKEWGKKKDSDANGEGGASWNGGWKNSKWENGNWKEWSPKKDGKGGSPKGSGKKKGDGKGDGKDKGEKGKGEKGKGEDGAKGVSKKKAPALEEKPDKKPVWKPKKGEAE